MRRRKNDLNRKLTKILFSMIAILLVVLVVINIDTELFSNTKGSESSPSVPDDSLDTETSHDNNDPSGAIIDPNDYIDPSPIEDTSIEGDEQSVNDIEEVKDPLPAEPIVLTFAGDINFDEDSKPVARYDSENKGILGGISKDLVNEMNEADVFMLNNEFAYSTRGSEIIEKSYTFRAQPKRVEILKEMGVDIVSLANNHALDFGVDALLDTFTTLDEAGIDYVGAGANMDRAKAPIYHTIGDTTIAYLAASHVIYAMDWYATDIRPGMIGTYDPTLFVTSIEEAKKNSDFVVVYVHWGKERTHEPVSYQKNLAKIYIDAGADAVIGCHPHVMQGIEFYKEKPIAYSLGNYWFNASKRETGLLKIYINPDGTTDTQLLPAMNDNTYTYMITEENEREAYYKFMEDISFDVKFDEDGFITEK
jgi:poly-gamma-glutamate synthesis protein (capsule biosynthesis protein)